MFGQYAAFVVPAYAITALAFAIAIARTFMSYKAKKRELAAIEGAKS